MTDPHLWLHGDPTGDRRIQPPRPADPPASPTPAPSSPPAPARRGGRLAAGAAGGAVSAALLTAGLFGLGVLDRDANAPASSRAPAAAPTVGGARPNGDVEQIYRSASAGVVSVRTGSGTAPAS